MGDRREIPDVVVLPLFGRGQLPSLTSYSQVARAEEPESVVSVVGDEVSTTH